VEPEADVEVEVDPVGVGLLEPVSELGVEVDEPLDDGSCDAVAGDEPTPVAGGDVWPLGAGVEGCCGAVMLESEPCAEVTPFVPPTSMAVWLLLPSLEMCTLVIGASRVTFWNCIPMSPNPPSVPCVVFWEPETARMSLLDPELDSLAPNSRLGAATAASEGVAPAVDVGVVVEPVGAH
jgi:hypothetical protein